MVKKLKEIIFVILMIGGIISTYNSCDLYYIRWPVIFGIMLLGILLTEIFLKEEPGELFEHFTIENWKNAKISSVLMIASVVALILSAINIWNAIMSR